jgi:TetR/AcrR family transcriptional repressor of nem operon
MSNLVKTRDPVRTRAQILNAGFREVYKNGFRAANIDNILKDAKLTKGAFFHHFPTKEDFGYAIVDEVLISLVAERWIRPLDDYENPLEGIALNFKKVIAMTPQSDLGLGCPLNNLMQEMAASDPKFAKKLYAVIESWIDGIELNLSRAQKRGYLRRGADLRRLAEFIVMSHEGAFGIVKMLKDRRVFFGLQASLHEYLTTFQKRDRS